MHLLSNIRRKLMEFDQFVDPTESENRKQGIKGIIPPIGSFIHLLHLVHLSLLLVTVKSLKINHLLS